ncbi:MAG: DUF1385 domain-containing protein [bacterium]|nr:DUF1385 domain-containing protein [bacterium]MDD5353996.1 DUF1385 domain-containing protein [bacterium]MDD5756133.1 DUF1385 domain-containing protein [bacterium]
MMRSPHYYAVAVRNPQGEIVIKTDKVRSIARKYPILKKFLLRGIVVLIESLVLGIKALNYSADVQMVDLQGDKKKDNTWMWIGTFAFAFTFGIGLFVVVPYFLTAKLVSYGFLFNVIDGLIRILFFISYIYIISMMADIRRVFQYHGAEHKAVFTHEAKEELTIENSRKYSPLHPRCGTAFLMVVMVVAIIIFSLIPISKEWPKLYQTLVKVGIRIIFIPLIAGLSYEIIKWADRKRNIFTNFLIAPGLWLQNMTTKEPDDKQLEVAIAALKEVLRLESARAGGTDNSLEVVP